MRLKVTIFVWLLAVAGVGLPVGLQAQYLDHQYGLSETGHNSLWIDHAVFQAADPQLMRVEVYYKIFNYGLTFEKEGGVHKATYEVHIAIEDNDAIAIQTYSSEKEVVVSDAARTRSLLDYRASLAMFDLPPGKYRVNFLLQDGVSESTYRHEFKIKLKLPNEQRSELSDIMFVQHTEPANDRESIFRKGDMIVIPSVSKEYGGEEDSKLIFYAEVYASPKDSDRLILETVLSSAGGKTLYRDTVSLLAKVRIHAQLKKVPIGELAPGDYTLELTLRGRRNRKLYQKREDFIVLWSQTAMLKNNYEDALRQLKLVAKPGEIKRMKKLELFEERLRAFNQFWKERDRTPETPYNESKIEFYRRISYANHRFRYMRQAGWSTDRGRIYVVHGEPDSVDDVPMSAGSPPYQIWHYYRGARYLRFLFIDDDLDNDYRLQWPYDGTGQRPDF